MMPTTFYISQRNNLFQTNSTLVHQTVSPCERVGSGDETRVFLASKFQMMPTTSILHISEKMKTHERNVHTFPYCSSTSWISSRTVSGERPPRNTFFVRWCAIGLLSSRGRARFTSTWGKGEGVKVREEKRGERVVGWNEHEKKTAISQQLYIWKIHSIAKYVHVFYWLTVTTFLHPFHLWRGAWLPVNRLRLGNCCMSQTQIPVSVWSHHLSWRQHQWCCPTCWSSPSVFLPLCWGGVHQWTSCSLAIWVRREEGRRGGGKRRAEERRGRGGEERRGGEKVGWVEGSVRRKKKGEKVMLE